MPRSLPACPLSPHAVEGGVGAADEVEGVADDEGIREHRLDRKPIGVVRVERDNLDRLAFLLGERAQVALDRAAASALDHLDDAASVEIGNDGRKLVAAAVVRLVEGDPFR